MKTVHAVKPGRVTRGALLVLAALLAAVAAGARATDDTPASWPQFRGPEGTGIAVADRPGPLEFGPDRNLLWNSPLPPGHSSPVVWGERIFVTAHDPERDRLETLCLDRHTGRVLWRQPAPPVPIEKVHAVSNPAAPTPVTDGESVVVYFGSYGLVAYDFEGMRRWAHPLPPARTYKDLGSGSSPALVEGRVLLDVPQGEESFLLALRARDGAPLWKRRSAGQYATPLAWREAEGTRVGVFDDGRFVALDLADGAEHFWLDDLPLNTTATPVVAGGRLFLTGTGGQGEVENLLPPPPFDEMIARYDRNGDGRIGTDELPDSLLHTDRGASGGAGNRTLREAFVRFFGARSADYDRAGWEEKVVALEEFARSRRMQSAVLAVRLGGRGDVTRSHVLWREERRVPEVPSPLVYRERLVVLKNGGIVVAREAATGRTVFEGRLGAPGGYYASPVAGGGRIYAASDAGVVTVFAAGDTLEVLARADLGEAVFATPAIAGGNLYVRTARHLYAFGERAPATGQ
jgi:outer membrane protein assembly factor BamB